MKIFEIEDLEKYREECQKTGRISIKFENGFFFFSFEVLGYILTTKTRKDNKRAIEKVAQSKDWEEFKKQVEEWCYENK